MSEAVRQVVEAHFGAIVSQSSAEIVFEVPADQAANIVRLTLSGHQPMLIGSRTRLMERRRWDSMGNRWIMLGEHEPTTVYEYRCPAVPGPIPKTTNGPRF